MTFFLTLSYPCGIRFFTKQVVIPALIILFAFLCLPSLAQAPDPVWLTYRTDNDFSSPSANVYQTNILVTAEIEQPGVVDKTTKVYFAIFNVALSSTPSAALVESYAKKKSVPANLVATDSLVIQQDSVEYTKKISNVLENKKYYTYMVAKGNNGEFNAVKKITLYAFKAKKLAAHFYTEYLPANVNNGNKYPIIIFLHGHGESGTEISTLAKVDVHGPPKRIAGGTDFPFIILSPQTSTAGWKPDQLDAFIEAVKIAYPQADLYRLYLTGLSMGGYGTWNYALRHPDKLAAIIPISGSTDAQSLACNISKIPVWAFHDKPDNTVDTRGTTNMEDRINNCPGSITPQVTLFENFDADGNSKSAHSIWTAAYGDNPSPASTPTRNVIERPAPVHDDTTVYEWLLKYKRTFLGPLTQVEPSKTIQALSTTISATATHPESSSSIVSYSWALVKTDPARPAPTLSGTSTLTLSVSGLVTATKYTFRLTVTDSRGYLDTDEMILTVNQPPVANAGPDKVLTFPTNSTTINGSGTDSDGEIDKYRWTKIAPTTGPTPTMGGTTTATLTLSNLRQIDYIFRLTVTDDMGLTHTDDVLVRVLPAGSNIPPVANAGTDVTISLPQNSVSLSGSGTDSDGTITGYAWVQSGGPTSATITNANTRTPSVGGLSVGTYVFQLTVTDNANATGTDNVSVIVQPAPQAATWNSYDINMEQRVIASSGNAIQATVEFYESTNNFGVDKGSLLPVYTAGNHGGANSAANNYWANASGAFYPFAGKSTVGRGGETSEEDVPAPLGVFDLQLHPPNNDHLTVAGFVVPVNGSYSITSFGVRRVLSSGGTARLRIFTTNKTEIISLQANTNRDWVVGANPIELGNLVAGDRIYFATDRDGSYNFDFTEVTWTIQRAASAAAARTASLPVVEAAASRETSTVLYPNPAKNTLHVQNVSKSSEIKIFNALSMPVIHANATTNVDGSVDIEIDKLSPGVYYLTIDDELGGGKRYKFIKE